jgi:hypothetical protein
MLHSIALNYSAIRDHLTKSLNVCSLHFGGVYGVSSPQVGSIALTLTALTPVLVS